MRCSSTTGAGATTARRRFSRGTIPQRSAGGLGQMRRLGDYGANGYTTEKRRNGGSTEKTTDSVYKYRGSTGRPAQQADWRGRINRDNERVSTTRGVRCRD